MGSTNAFLPLQEAIRVCVTGGAGQIGYALLPLIASGQMFGPGQPVRLNLLEVCPNLSSPLLSSSLSISLSLSLPFSTSLPLIHYCP